MLQESRSGLRHHFLIHMTRKQKKVLWRIIAAAALFIAALFAPVDGLWQLPMFLIPYLVIGWDVLWKAARNIVHGQIFDENFLMSIATVGALILGEYAEAVGVMLFYQVGELFQSCAVVKSRRSIARLMDIRPDTARVLRSGEWMEADPEEIYPDDIIEVRPGEKIPLDGIVLEGNSSLDTAALTGESIPRDVAVGNEVLSGCVSLTGVLRLRVTKEYSQSTVAKILDLVENAASKKARSEQFITRFARYYTPAVVIGAVLLAVIPSLIFGTWALWIKRALMFLVISCPCALVISVPLSFFGGIGGASAKGILIKGGSYLELLAKTGTVVFDKTGTLTQGIFEVHSLSPVEGVQWEYLLEQAALAECFSNHPIAQSLRRAYGHDIDPTRVTDIQELPGHGITALVDGVSIAAGNEKLMQSLSLPVPSEKQAGTVVYVAQGERYLGCIVISDAPKNTAAQAVSSLRQRGIRTVMLTGDSEAAAQETAKQLGLDSVHSRLLPADKVEWVEKLLDETHPHVLVYVGDGVNDAPVLSRADVGIAMGALGSDAAIEAADIVLMDDDPTKLTVAMDIARKCLRIVRQNIVFALGVKGLFLLLGALGIANMWAAVFADVGVAVLAILNAMRMLKNQ